jgi:hypothetical protein
MGDLARIEFGQSDDFEAGRSEVDPTDPEEESIELIVRRAIDATLFMRKKASLYSAGEAELGQVAEAIGRLEDVTRNLTLGEQAFVLVAADVEYADQLLNPPDNTNVHDINERKK